MTTIAIYAFTCLCGMIFVTANEQGNERCNYRTFLTTCCSNDENMNIHNNDDSIIKICEACIGHPCRKCPWGYYGEQCNETCTCGTELCDDVLGCVTTENTSTSVNEKNTENTSTSVDEKNTDLQKYSRKRLGMILQSFLFGSIFIIILLLAVLLRVVYRARKNSRRYQEVSTERSASYVEDITRDSTVIYAAVVRPNRKPVRGVEQSDQMYGKMPKPQTSDQEGDNKAKCLDINISNNPEGEGLKIGSSTTYSFVRIPDRTLSQDLEQCDQAYGNMTTRV